MGHLGERKERFLFTCTGFVLPADARKFLTNLVNCVGMTPARRHPIDDYPYDNGEQSGGGFGYTLYQPLMESFAIMDVYYDLNQTEVFISTCKPDRLDVDAVLSFLAKEIGPASGGRLIEEG